MKSNSINFGTIPCVEDAFGATLTKELPIVVPVGDISFGYTHVHAKHRQKIAHYHAGMDVLNYVSLVAAHYHEIYMQADGNIRLLKYNGIKNAIIAQHAYIDRECYKLITAFPLDRLPNFKKRKERLIWTR